MSSFKNIINNAKIGKVLPKDYYIHNKCLRFVDPLIRTTVAFAFHLIKNPCNLHITIIKISKAADKVSFLWYPEFDIVAHPAIFQSICVKLGEKTVRVIDYIKSKNPSILHRKELFVDKSYPGYDKFRKLTEEEEKIGLLNNSNNIGTRNQWGLRLAEYNCFIVGHKVFKEKR